MLGLGEMPAELREDLLDQAGETLFRSVLMRAGNKLSKEDVAELAQLMDADAPFDELIMFLEDRVTDFEQIFIEEGARIREALVAA